MNKNPEPTAYVEHVLITRLIDLETDALLHTVLGGFLEIDLQFKLVVDKFTGGNVITHLAREADRMADELFKATERSVPPIDAQRQYEIDPGGMRPAAVLIEDFVESSTRLQEALGGVDDETMHRDDIRNMPAQRLLQLVVHHADLGRSWNVIPEEVAATAVTQLSTVMADEGSTTRLVVQPERALVSDMTDDGATVITGDAPALLAWATGRTDIADFNVGAVLPAVARRIWF